MGVRTTRSCPPGILRVKCLRAQVRQRRRAQQQQFFDQHDGALGLQPTRGAAGASLGTIPGVGTVGSESTEALRPPERSQDVFGFRGAGTPQMQEQGLATAQQTMPFQGAFGVGASNQAMQQPQFVQEQQFGQQQFGQQQFGHQEFGQQQLGQLQPGQQQ
eukprot:2723930-Pleurochrysis_carterae.AAC.1